MASPEQSLQRLIVDWMQRCVPPPPAGPYWTAVNPVPAKSRAAAGMSKALGMKAGFGDFLLVFEGRAISGELKAPKRSPTAVQIAFYQDFCRAGGRYRVVRSLHEWIAWMAELGVPYDLRLTLRYIAQVA